jgi:RecA/RadA recombinase
MVIFINQLRIKIGILMPGQSPETTTGGNALKFYASVRLDIRRLYLPFRWHQRDPAKVRNFVSRLLHSAAVF